MQAWAAHHELSGDEAGPDVAFSETRCVASPDLASILSTFLQRLCHAIVFRIIASADTRPSLRRRNSGECQ
ncbi:uncharacterized protein SPSK_05775 [Sporothrix schenckii 1099-18]|uniref:Uncharacterized protein n=1 Tax=Sporothrix schenckii 1099-18 TaxID=1397361 RepID=A0A0F2LY53_SPOSC|nr:uncharacterized protein SPSK_05775 [Sporothrix schenckii 1099-18]KJR80826.1 hypothetical protein SPSK_05775 [Sporothrix schenckii 1099-18]